MCLQISDIRPCSTCVSYYNNGNNLTQPLNIGDTLSFANGSGPGLAHTFDFFFNSTDTVFYNLTAVGIPTVPFENYYCNLSVAFIQVFDGCDKNYTVFSPTTQKVCATNSALTIDNLKSASTKISPNPATTSFTLQLSSPPSTQTYFQLYDALGRQVKREEINSISTTINRDNLPSGIYFWQLQSNNKVLQRGKVVMQ